MKPLGKSLGLKRSLALGISALFVLVLITSQPHRVHHVFEQIDHARHDPETPSKHHNDSKGPDKAPQTECVVRAVAQDCSALPVTLATIPIIPIAGQTNHPVLRRWIYRFVSSPFLQRAPPDTGTSFSI